ncbi:Crp/Fnr family transcriptional regulator [Sphingomonas sp. PB4P5]|uniref:Crp/Fnr family transcriptional regulator n=1 Tax=Parasphingomonas puruogangriensis TaxID=3096155 RepID=UPI002FC87AB7
MADYVITGLHPFIDRLSSHSILSDLEKQALSNLSARPLQVKAQRDIVRLDTQTNDACFIVDGIAGRFGQNLNGERQITAFHIPGDMADLHSVVLPNATSALQALTDTSVLLVPHTELRSVAARFPGVAEAFWRECMIGAAMLSQWVVNVGRRDASTRLAHLFCEMAVRYGATLDQAGSYRFPVTQDHLGDATGLTGVHVNRTMKLLRNAGLVRMQLKEVEIMDWNGLRLAGQFDASYLGMRMRETQPLRLLDLAL